MIAWDPANLLSASIFQEAANDRLDPLDLLLFDGLYWAVLCLVRLCQTCMVMVNKCNEEVV